MKDYDWSKFTLRIPIKADIHQIYNFWTTQDGLEKWFLKKAEFKKTEKSLRDRNSQIQKNDTYEWSWYGYSDDSVERGTVLETNGKDFLKFIFGKAGIVNVYIKTEQTGNIVELEQSEMQVDEKSKINFHLSCSKGWVFYLTNLKSVLEGGLDMRNKDINLKEVISS
jgi:uncharacterized protein YndB with AHSA1/START domain